MEMVMQDKSRIQEIELDLLMQIDRVCKKNGIPYFVIGGTMLGAVRHNGFIPWDDDIDIGMLRDDYEKFSYIAEKELKEPYKLNTFKNCGNHHYYFMHVVNTKYSVRRLGSIDQRIENVWVDIYPIDGFPSNMIVQKIEYVKLQFYRFMYHLGFFEKVNLARPGRPVYQKVLLFLAKRIYKFIPINGCYWRNLMDKELKKMSERYSDYYINFIGMQGIRELFHKSVLFPVKEYKFEDIVVEGPNMYDKYLTQLYGDWRIPPKCKNVHPMEIV